MLGRRRYPGGRFVPQVLGLDGAARRDVLKDAGERWMVETRHGLWSLAWLVGGIAVMAGVLAALWPVFRSGWVGASAGFVLYPFLIAWWTLYQWWRGRSLAPCVWAALRDRGHDVCRGCGYFRGGIDPDAVCPECGVRSAPLPVH